MKFSTIYTIMVVLWLMPFSAFTQDTNSPVVVTSEFIPDNYENEISPLQENDNAKLEERKIGPEKIRDLKKDDAFWYVDQDHVQEKKPEQPGESWLEGLASQPWFEPVIWTLIIGSFITIIIWFLIASGVLVFGKRTAKINKPAGDDPYENIFETDFDKAVREAVHAGNYRLAVRLMYLGLLRDLSNRDVIAYKPQRTNSEYVSQLYGTDYYKSFFSITRNFEWAWYGGFPVSPAAYDSIRSEVDDLKSSLA